MAQIIGGVFHSFNPELTVGYDPENVLAPATDASVDKQARRVQTTTFAYRGDSEDYPADVVVTCRKGKGNSYGSIGISTPVLDDTTFEQIGTLRFDLALQYSAAAGKENVPLALPDAEFARLIVQTAHLLTSESAQATGMNRAAVMLKIGRFAP